MRRGSVGSVAVLLALVAASCGGEGVDAVFPGTDPAASTGAGDSTTSTISGGSTASGSSAAPRTSVAEEPDTGVVALTEALATEAPGPIDPTPAARVGGPPDRDTAAAITDDVAAAGVALTGIEFWVFPVVGSVDVLLVMEIDESAEQLLEDPAGQALLEALVESEIPASAGVTRFVMNYRSADAEGPFVLTATIGWEFLVAGIRDEIDTGDEMRLQMTRGGEVVEG